MSKGQSLPGNVGSIEDVVTMEEVMIPGNKVGLVIGKGGRNIKMMQEKAGVKMVMIQDSNAPTAVDKPLRITGEPGRVALAKEMVFDLIAKKEAQTTSFGGNKYGDTGIVPPNSVSTSQPVVQPMYFPCNQFTPHGFPPAHTVHDQLQQGQNIRPKYPQQNTGIVPPNSVSISQPEVKPMNFPSNQIPNYGASPNDILTAPYDFVSMPAPHGFVPMPGYIPRYTGPTVHDQQQPCQSITYQTTPEYTQQIMDTGIVPPNSVSISQPEVQSMNFPSNQIPNYGASPNDILTTPHDFVSMPAPHGFVPMPGLISRYTAPTVHDQEQQGQNITYQTRPEYTQQSMDTGIVPQNSVSISQPEVQPMNFPYQISNYGASPSDILTARHRYTASTVHDQQQQGQNITYETRPEYTQQIMGQYQSTMYRPSNTGFPRVRKKSLQSMVSKKSVKRPLDESLIEATRSNDIRKVETLIKQGADVKCTDIWGETPLYTASFHGHSQCVELLLSAGSDPNARDNEGETPLYIASFHGHSQCVELLLSAGSDPNARDVEDTIPLDMSDNYEVKGLLIKTMATAQQKWIIEMVNKAENSRKDVREHLIDVAIKGHSSYRPIEDTDVFEMSCSNLSDQNLIQQLNELPSNKEYRLLNLCNNKLTKLPDLGKYPQFKKLVFLTISYNDIKVLEGLPGSPLEGIWMDGNPIEVLHQGCFHPQSFYVLKSSLKMVHLIQPPQEVIHRGFEEVHRYFEQGQLLLKSGYRLVNIGNTCAGKTSLIEALIRGEPYLTDEADRTRVVDVKRWEPNETDTFVIYDQGGHVIYDITNPFFISRRCTVLITHDISDLGSISRTLDFFRRTLHQFPSNETHFVLSKTDALDKKAITSNSHGFKDDIDKLLNDEIDTCTRLLRSSQKSYIDTEQVEHFIQCCTNKLKDIQYFPVSSKNYSGIIELREFLLVQMKRQRVAIPMTWIDLYNKIMINECNFLRTNDLKPQPKEDSDFPWLPMDSYNEMDSDNEMEQFMPCLRYLNDTGNIIWFENSDPLSNYVFHQAEFIVKILKSLFSHDLRSELDYHKNKEVQHFFQEEELERTISKYTKEGLLEWKLLKFLWKQYDLNTDDVSAFIMLIKAFHIFNEVKEVDDINDTIYFVPWLVKQNQSPQNLNIDQPIEITDELITLNVETLFHNRIPINVTEMCLVQLQKFAVTEGYMGARYSWKDGLQIKLGPAVINAFRNDETSSIKILTRSHYQHLPQSWNYLHTLHDSIQHILQSWHGAIKSQHSICLHCVCDKICPPHRWLPREFFPSKAYSLEYVNCNRDQSAIPAAMVTKIQTENQQQSIENVKMYLQEKFTKKMPETVQYRTVGSATAQYSTAADSKLTEDQTKYVLDQLCPSVCSVICPGVAGTGFVIGPITDPTTGLVHRLVLTCGHVKLQHAFRDNQHCKAVFEDTPGKPGCQVDILHYILYCNESMDYVLVGLQHSLELERHLDHIVPLGELVTLNTPYPNDPLVLIGSVAEDRKKIDFGAYSVLPPRPFEDIAKYRRRVKMYPLNETSTFYHCHSFGGTSGSPCFSVPKQRLYAMHCGNIPIDPNPNGDLTITVEHGILLYHVACDIKRQVEQQQLQHQQLQQQQLLQQPQLPQQQLQQPGSQKPQLDIATLEKLFPVLKQMDTSG